MPSFQSPQPDQRQAVRAKPQAVPDRPHAMLVECPRLLGALRQVVVRFLVGIHRAAVKERDALVEHAGVAGRRYVAARRVGQPQVIVRKVRPHAASGRRMPPVLNVPLAKLAAGAAQQVLARRSTAPRGSGPRCPGADRGSRTRPADLVVPAASPIPAGERLVLQPAVDQDVQRAVGRLHVDHAQRPLPELPHLFQRLARAAPCR